MEEVKPVAVAAYLDAMRQDGYSIVALEQSSDSVCLTKFTFPDKVHITYLQGIAARLLVFFAPATTSRNLQRPARIFGATKR